MSEYVGFIPLDKFIELRDELCQITDTRGLENKFHHLYQPDTDMNSKVCENFKDSKDMIVADLMKMLNEILLLAIKISNLKER